MHKVVIIGAGGIAGGYDHPGAEVILSHAHAIRKASDFELTGVFDPDSEKASEFSEKWSTRPIKSVHELEASGADVFVICSPDPTHVSWLKQLIRLKPRAVICEKPLSQSWEEGKEYAELYKSQGVHLLVNYQRQFEPHFYKWGRWMQQNSSELLFISLGYSKGVRHTGTHAFVYLMSQLGLPHGFIKTSEIYDFNQLDPSVGGVLFFDQCPVYLMPGDERAYSLFEMDFVHRKGRKKFYQGSVRYENWSIGEDPVFPGFKEILREEEGETQFANSLPAVYSFLRQKLVVDSQEETLCPIDAVIAQYLADILATSPMNLKVELEFPRLKEVE